MLLALLCCLMAADFSGWWAGFQGAVAKRDASVVADGPQFPMDWENGPVRRIDSRAELVGKFDLYFTAEIRKAVAAGKPERYGDGKYSITWKARGNEYSMYFESDGKGGFRLAGLSEGPG
jgi:hypothetical protein